MNQLYCTDCNRIVDERAISSCDLPRIFWFFGLFPFYGRKCGFLIFIEKVEIQNPFWLVHTKTSSIIVVYPS